MEYGHRKFFILKPSPILFLNQSHSYFYLYALNNQLQQPFIKALIKYKK